MRKVREAWLAVSLRDSPTVGRGFGGPGNLPWARGRLVIGERGGKGEEPITECVSALQAHSSHPNVTVGRREVIDLFP